MFTAENLQRETERLCPKDASRQQAERQAQRRLRELNERMAALASTAKTQGRMMGESEKAEWSLYYNECERFSKEPLPLGIKLDDPTGDNDEPHTAGTRFLTRDGREIRALAPHEKLSDLPLPDNRVFQPLSLGRAIVGLATGKWDNARAERLAMAEGGNAVGGYLVPEAFTKTVIDYARNRTAVIKAGALTVPWPSPSDRLVMARVNADPTFAVVAENAEIISQDMTFTQIGFDAQKIACLVSLSRELAEDAPNAPDLIEQTIGRALATELDRLALVGSGSAEPNGLLNYTGIESTDSIGAISWEAVHAAKVEVEDNNFDPTGYICSPTIGGDLDILTGGDGETVAKAWLGPPPSLTGIPRFVTKNCPDANLFIGDWSQFVFALRQDAMIEVSTSAGDAFKKHQLLIKLTWRGDVGCLNAAAFHVLKGITS